MITTIIMIAALYNVEFIGELHVTFYILVWLRSLTTRHTRLDSTAALFSTSWSSLGASSRRLWHQQQYRVRNA